MTILSIPILFWAVMLFYCNALILGLALKAYHIGVDYAKKQKKLLEEVEEDLKNRYNRVATLPMTDLMKFLSNAYSRSLEIEAKTHSSDKDPNAAPTLYLRSLSNLLEFLGPDIIASLDFYYGAEFIERWTEVNYRILNERGYIDRLISNPWDIRAETVEEVLLRNEGITPETAKPARGKTEG